MSTIRGAPPGRVTVGGQRGPDVPPGLVSLIMPVWRPVEAWLRTAVESVLAQTDCPLELIVVDDGCPEPVAALLHDLGDPRLRVDRIAHGGVSRARDAGIAVARGEWLRFVDADDALPPESTAHLLRLARGDPRVIPYGATLYCDADLRPLHAEHCDLRGDVRTDCLLGRFRVMLPAMLFHRRVIERTGAWDPELPISQDWDFVLRALDHARVRGDRTVVAYYRQNEGSASRSRGEEGIPAPRGALMARRVVARYFERHPEERGTRTERDAARMLAVLELSQRLGGAGTWWRTRRFWASLVSRPRDTASALPALVRSSLPPGLEHWLHRLRRAQGPRLPPR